MKQNTWQRLAKAALETLEGRNMMSASPATITLANGVLTMDAASGGPAHMTVDYGANTTQLEAHTANLWDSFPINQVKEIVINGGAEADNIYLNPEIAIPAQINTGDGNDSLRSGGGNDTIVTGNGNDWVKVVRGNNIITLGNGNDYVDLTKNADTVTAGSGKDFIDGGFGHGTVLNAGPNTTVIDDKHVTVESGKGGSGMTAQPVNSTGTSGTETSTGGSGTSTAPVGPTPTPVIDLLAGVRQTGLSVSANALSSTMGAGQMIDGTFVWNFGDASGDHNSITGFTASHVYDQPGTYTISLTVTNVDGVSATATQQVTIAAASRKIIYVDANNGSDSNAGTQTAPLQSFAAAMAQVGDNTEILFKAGETYTVSASVEIDATNVLIGSYGSGADPMLSRAGGNGISTFTIDGDADGVTIQHMQFNCPWGAVAEDAQAPKMGNSGIYVGGSNITIRDCTFLNLDDAINENKNPVGVLVEDNTAPLDTGVRGYFDWVQGSEQTIVGNTVANSTREHNIRMSGWTDVTVTDNTLANLSRQSVDPYDTSKGCIELHEGSYGYVTDNSCTDGDIRTGPLGLWGEDPSDTTSNCVIEDNQLTDTFVFVQAGSQHVMISNNVINQDSGQAITVAGPNGSFSSADITISNNTAVNNGTQGNFLYLTGAVNGIALNNNLWVAPEIQPGLYSTAALRISQPDLSSFTSISNNVWPTGQNGYAYANGGVMEIALPGDGYITDAQWLQLSPVKGDTFEDVHLTDLDAVYQLNVNGQMVGAAVKLAA